MQTIIAAFDDRQSAQRAVERLVQQGFPRDAVHLQAGRAAATGTTGARTDDEDRGFFESIGDFFGDLFGDDSRDDAGVYTEAVRRGGTVVVVDARTQTEEDQARTVLQSCGAFDVDERATQWRGEGWGGQAAPAQARAGRQGYADDDRFAGQAQAGQRPAGERVGENEQTVMPVVQEELEVGKRAVAGGGVRVIKRVTETPVSEMVRLREEHAHVERRPADRAATEADLANFEEGTVEVREMSEEAVVAKKARVVEEVVVGKEVTERSETVSDTVRKTDVEVERVAGDDRAAATRNGNVRGNPDRT